MEFPLLLFLSIFCFFAVSISTVTSLSIPSQYSRYCNDVVPEQPPSDKPLGATADGPLLKLTHAFSAGGDPLLSPRQDSRSSVSFGTRKSLPTENDAVFKLESVLTFWGRRVIPHRRLLRLVHYRPPRIPIQNGQSKFQLYGFWSSASGKLCMVGSGLNNLRSVNVVLKLNYPNSANILTSLVNGTLESLDLKGSSNYFKPISILGVSSRRYEYSLIDTEFKNNVFSLDDDSVENLPFKNDKHEFCSAILWAGRVELQYMNVGCDKVNCNPLGRGVSVLPDYMSFNEIECSDDGKVRYLLSFTNSSRNGRLLPFNPSTTLVAEGAWNREKSYLGLVACRIPNVTDWLVKKGVVEDCSIRLRLSVPATLSLKNRSFVVGRIWSNESLNDSGYFSPLEFWSSTNRYTGRLNGGMLRGLKYAYTEYEHLRTTCEKTMKVSSEGGRYPDAYSPDMTFDMTVKKWKGFTMWGYSSPFTVGNEFHPSLVGMRGSPFETAQVNYSHSDIVNISFVMGFRSLRDFQLGGKLPPTNSLEISAEGIYDSKTGHLCMMGCRHLKTPGEKSMGNKSLDCDIRVDMQYSPLNSNVKRHVKGTIESSRSKSDPLYFEPLEFSSRSLYTGQAEKSIWRMDLEITMVVISNTLACIFLVMQLLYVNKNPQVLPYISVMMAVFLTLAHMIPLLLNFEALFFANHNRQNVFVGGGGWLEVNEVLVRVITMVAFLLQFWLLQLTWSGRVDSESKKNLWVSDRKVFCLLLPLYLVGGLIAWFAHHLIHDSGYQQHSFWEGLKSYAGLVLDGFLLPQILFNIFCNSTEKALAPTFYIGTTVVRLLPHAYDFYRAHSPVWFPEFIYANPRMDYYSNTWDVIIPCGGVLFIILIYFQQRYGGCCFLPKRFRQDSVYEKVPEVALI